MSVFSGPHTASPPARLPLQLPVHAVLSTRAALAPTPRSASMFTPTDAGTSWRKTVCPWAPQRKAAQASAAGTPAASPMSSATPLGLTVPVNFWPMPSSWAGDHGSTPLSSGSVHTPHGAAGTLYRTFSCPGAPERKPAPRLCAQSPGATPVASPLISPVTPTTPVNFWPGTPGSGCGSKSLPLRGPLVRLMHACSADTTPFASVRRGSFTSMPSTSHRGFEGLTPMSVDATPINYEASPSVAERQSDWLSSFLTEGDTPTVSLNQARFLDSQPSTPVSMLWPATPQNGRGSVSPNAFGMPTVEEGDNAMSPEEVPSASPQQGVLDSASVDKPKQDEDDWMPPAESIMGGA